MRKLGPVEGHLQKGQPVDRPGPHDAPVLRTGLTIQGLGPHVQLCSRYSAASGTQLGAQVGGWHPARNEGGGFVQV